MSSRAPPQTPSIPSSLPVIPLRNNRVVLPGVVLRLNIGRSNTITLIEKLWQATSSTSRPIVACVPLKANAPSRQKENKDAKIGQSGANTQQSAPAKDEAPLAPSELHEMGCAARVLAIQKVQPTQNQQQGDAKDAKGKEGKGEKASTPQNNARVIYAVTVEGISRVKLNGFTKIDPYIEATITNLTDAQATWNKDETESSALALSLRSTSHELANLLSQMQLPGSVVTQLRSMIDDTQPPRLADMVASMIDLSIEEKLSVLDAVEPKDRIEKVLKLLARQIQVLKISRKLQTTVEGKLGEKQREAILREQMNAIKQELGEKDEDQDEIEELVKRIKDSNLPEEADKAAQREIKRLKRMHPSMAEYQVVRSYLEWLADLPWNKVSEDRLDIDSARKQLNEDHYGLEKIKTRILEFLAVRKLKKDMRGPILCFVGPPGVGKTSLGKSIAAALNRKFYRISLGGVRDEAEIRGHRRTYIGAMPGMVIQGMRRCGTANPVFLLDEIDKLGRDFRGDPSSALLEVLDPEQNSTFNDHYINVPFDLSKVFFIATANEESTIPGPLLDRMEIIRLPGYTFDEKLHIARKYLLPKQITAHGLSVEDVKMDDEVIMKIATGYTREAGVRNLEREVAGVVRGLAVEYTEGKEKGSSYEPQVSLEKLAKILGPEMFDDEVAERQQIPGVVTGLAWTAMGGGLLFIEATEMPGRGQIHLTGKLGDVIKESAQVAVAWVRAHASALGITKDGKDSLFDKADIHIHFPAGATPKDGPSAGVTIVTAVVGLLTGKAVKDHTAMTGEITLRGQVLPVGGIKEKVLAAHRGGIKNIIIPFRNRKDLVEIPENVRADINFTFAKAIEDVLRAAFDDGEEMTKILGKTRFIGNGQVEARL